VRAVTGRDHVAELLLDLADLGSVRKAAAGARERTADLVGVVPDRA
jgi:hypothetical protein